MKFIRVTGCHDCLYPDFEYLPPYIPCKHPNMPDDFNVNVFIDTKTLPDNCQLQDAVQIITRLEVEEKMGSAK